MEDIDSAVMLKEKLLTAGIDEILTHGMGDFSLRRVAASCGASCAAPYKHFKNKEEFIRATIAFIEEKWNHLADQIISSVEDPVGKNRFALSCKYQVQDRKPSVRYEQRFFRSQDNGTDTSVISIRRGSSFQIIGDIRSFSPHLRYCSSYERGED